MISPLKTNARWTRSNSLLLCSLIALYTAAVPLFRTFCTLEVDYNEGWNIYNASLLAQHKLLYPAKYSWTTNNYPMLSFYLFEQLHRLTHDYLFTARAVSLLALIGASALVGLITNAIGTSRRSAYIAGLFCFATFCADADFYVGMDDPQLLSLVFFLLGLFVYIKTGRSTMGIIATAFLCVFAGCIKYNPVDFPIAISLDLLCVSATLSAVFALSACAFCVVAVLLNIHFGGPYFLQEILLSRSYSLPHIAIQIKDVFGPLLVPFLLALWTFWKIRTNPRQRLISILMLLSLTIGAYFSGGSGVSINCFFSCILAMSIVLGVWIDGRFNGNPKWNTLLCTEDKELLLFLWLLIPLALSGNINLVRSFHKLEAAQSAFRQDVAFLRGHPGPAICESLLECNFAEKPYSYDPFNATRLIAAGHLDVAVMVRQVQERRYSIIQVNNDGTPQNLERFNPAILNAIHEHYVTLHESASSILYVPLGP